MRPLFALAVTLFVSTCLAQPATTTPKEFAFGPATARMTDPNQTLAGVEADIKELMGQNDKKMFGLSPGGSEKAKTMLASMQRGISTLRVKYRRVKEPVDAAPLYQEIEDTLEK